MRRELRPLTDSASAVLFLLVGAQAVNWLLGSPQGDSGTFRQYAVALQAALGLASALWLWRGGRTRRRGE